MIISNGTLDVNIFNKTVAISPTQKKTKEAVLITVVILLVSKFIPIVAASVIEEKPKIEKTIIR